MIGEQKSVILIYSKLHLAVLKRQIALIQLIQC